MTIFMSAMYGVCMMIYVFGDLRQLRSFELTRPARAMTPPPTPSSPTSPNGLKEKSGMYPNKEERVVKVSTRFVGFGPEKKMTLAVGPKGGIPRLCLAARLVLCKVKSVSQGSDDVHD